MLKLGMDDFASCSEKVSRNIHLNVENMSRTHDSIILLIESVSSMIPFLIYFFFFSLSLSLSWLGVTFPLIALDEMYILLS